MMSGTLRRSKDWTQARDLSKEMPEKLRELQRLWLIEAAKYNVLPLDDRRQERFNPDLAGRPTLIRGNSQLLFRRHGRLSENCVVVMKNKSFSITAELEVPAKGAEASSSPRAVLRRLSLYAKGGRQSSPTTSSCPNLYDRCRPADPGGQAPGAHEFTYDGGGLAKGGNVTLYYDGRKVGEGRVEHTVRCSSPPMRRRTWAGERHAGDARLQARDQRVHR